MAYVRKAFEHFQYSFVVTLFDSEVSTVNQETQETVDVPKDLLVFKESVQNRKLKPPNKNNVIIKKHIGRSHDYKVPLILYVKDLTTYERGQPMLELNLDISSAFTERARANAPLLERGDTPLVDVFRYYKPNIIHLSFQTRRSSNINHRQIEMPLPPLETFELSFNLERMIR